MVSTSMHYQIHSQPSGGHWVAWLTAGENTSPAGATILVGRTRDEAEENAQHWADRLNEDPRLLRG